MKECCEKAYILGQKQVYGKLFGIAARELNYDKEKINFNERIDTIAKLRSECESFGDNDWPDDLYLPDIIEKHLCDYFDRSLRT